jgi:hypothetical protein
MNTELITKKLKEIEMDKIEFGDKVKERISGFTGIVTGYATYITGCNKVLIDSNKVSPGGDVQQMWTDEDRVKIIKKKAFVLNPEPKSKPETGFSGGPMSTPKF